jgi:hypothetical protein
MIISAVIVAVIGSAIAAVPVWLIWNHLAPTYFAGLPSVWHDVPFLDAWLFALLAWALFKSNTSSKSS